MLEFFRDLLKPSPPPDPEVLRAIGRIPDIVDPILASLPGLERKIIETTRTALDHCRAVVAQVTGPIEVERSDFSSDPLVHALFATADDIPQMFGKSQAVRDYLAATAATPADCFHALLAVRQRAKKTLGVALEGGVMRSDVPMEYLYFSDHTLVEPAATLEETRLQLTRTAFDGLLRGFRLHLDNLRQERQTLRDDRDLQRDQMAMARARSDPIELAEHSRRLDELDGNLRRYADLLQADNIVSALAEFLAAPASALRLEPVNVSVDRTGRIVENPEPGQVGVDTLSLQQVIGRDRRRYIAMLARIRRADAERAVAEVKETQKRYLII